MDANGLIWNESSVFVSNTGWALVAAGDYQREYLGLTATASGATGFISMRSGGTNGAGAITPTTFVTVPTLRWTIDADGPLVWQEWWMKMSTAPATWIVWTLRRISGPRPARQTPGGIILPDTNGRANELGGYDRAKMDTMLAEMRRRTRRLTRA